VLRLRAGEGYSALAAELGVRRKLLYEWARSYARDGVAGLNRKRGPKPREFRGQGNSGDRIPGTGTEFRGQEFRGQYT
jgi:hypothetical protein